MARCDYRASLFGPITEASVSPYCPRCGVLGPGSQGVFSGACLEGLSAAFDSEPGQRAAGGTAAP